MGKAFTQLQCSRKSDNLNFALGMVVSNKSFWLSILSEISKCLKFSSWARISMCSDGLPPQGASFNSAMERLFNRLFAFKRDEISLTFVLEISKFSSMGKSSMIISRLVLLNSVPDTLRLDKFRNLDNATTMVFFFASTNVEFETFKVWKKMWNYSLHKICT